MKNKLVIKAEYVVSHPMAGSLHVMDIFKPHKGIHERLERARDGGKFHEINIDDAAPCREVSRRDHRILSVTKSEYHNTLIVTTSDI